MKAPIVAIALIFAALANAHAACAGRSGVRYGDTLLGIAQRCGINVQRLRDANPGLTGRTLQSGITINTPPPQLRTTMPTYRGNRSISGAQGTANDYHFGLPTPRPIRPVRPTPQVQQHQ